MYGCFWLIWPLFEEYILLKFHMFYIPNSTKTHSSAILHCFFFDILIFGTQKSNFELSSSIRDQLPNCWDLEVFIRSTLPYWASIGSDLNIWSSFCLLSPSSCVLSSKFLFTKLVTPSLFWSLDITANSLVS